MNAMALVIIFSFLFAACVAKCSKAERMSTSEQKKNPYLLNVVFREERENLCEVKNKIHTRNKVGIKFTFNFIFKFYSSKRKWTIPIEQNSSKRIFR